MRKDFIHVYHGSQGSGGLYTHEIYSVLEKYDIKQELFLSFYYPFNYGKKIFFKYTDLASGISKSKWRIYIRGLELIYGLSYTLIYVILFRPRFVNYNLISSYWIDFIFLKLIFYCSSSKIIITCHDVVPFGETIDSVRKQTLIRQKIFNLADCFIVHNVNSAKDLQNFFMVKDDVIFSHAFPIMDLRKININNNVSKVEYDFAFIGHFREGKGVDVLIEAWKLFHVEYPAAKLLLAGNIPDGSLLDLNCVDDYNVDLHSKYLSDKDYFDFLNKSKNIILPYVKGTNSGVLYNLFGMNVNILYSDIAMFRDNVLLNTEGMFKANDVNKLYEKLCEFYSVDLILENRKVEKYKEFFEDSTIEVYKLIMNKKI